MNGIKEQLVAFAEDEGNQSALNKAEKFRDVLEELMEISSETQQVHTGMLLDDVKAAIIRITDRMGIGPEDFKGLPTISQGAAVIPPLPDSGDEFGDWRGDEDRINHGK